MYFNCGLQRSLTSVFLAVFFNAFYAVTKKFLHEYDSNPKRIDNHHQRAYHLPTKQPAPSWVDSSTGRALHWYRRGHGLNLVQAWIFQPLLAVCNAGVNQITEPQCCFLQAKLTRGRWEGPKDSRSKTFFLPLSNHLSTPSSLSHDENNMAAKTRKVRTLKWICTQGLLVNQYSEETK